MKRLVYGLCLLISIVSTVPMVVAQNKTESSGRKYNNPVLPGSYCDPAVVRVGRKFYMVNTTFQFFPGISVCESEDLVHWKHITNVLNTKSDVFLDNYPDNLGVWACDIAYFDETFYIFYCMVYVTNDRKINVRGNYVVHAKQINGPWSTPLQLTTEGNDPSHFMDDDGEHYMVYAAGIPKGYGNKIVKLDRACTKVVEGPFWLNWGEEKRHPEGPHIYKRNGYYYHSMAYGDMKTGINQQAIARSKNIYGPYEPSPYNPLIIENGQGYTTNTEHAAFVEIPNGDWWAVYHSKRNINGANILGRETSLDKLTWREDGWPVVNEGKGITEENTAPDLPQKKYKTTERDNFSKPALSVEWQFSRNPDSSYFSLQERKGYLRLYTHPYDLDTMKSKGVVVKRETFINSEAITSMDFEAKGSAQAGMVCFYNTKNFIKLGLSGNQLLLIENRSGKMKQLQSTPVATNKKLFLKVQADSLVRSFYYSDDGKHWKAAGEVKNTDFLGGKYGYHGTMVGVYACDPSGKEKIKADFDFFTYRNRDGK